MKVLRLKKATVGEMSFCCDTYKLCCNEFKNSGC